MTAIEASDLTDYQDYLRRERRDRRVEISNRVKVHGLRWMGRCGCGAPANVRIQTILKPRTLDTPSHEIKTVGYIACERCATSRA
jgi:hypothetical protein